MSVIVGAARGAARGIESFEREIEEGLVLPVVHFRNPDWPPERSASIKLAVDRPGRVVEIAKKGIGIQILVPELEHGAAVDLVGAGFHHEVEQAAGGAALGGNVDRS